MSPLNADQVKFRLVGFFETRHEVIFAYLFGSVARGNAGPLSDIDIAVYLDPLQLPKKTGYGFHSELLVELQALLANDTDLVLLNQASTVTKYQVIKNGMLIFCRSEESRRDFHDHTVKAYLDLKPLLKVQRFYLQKRLATGIFGGGNVG
jgi:predicted nucleotidyltransferase